MIYIFLNFPYKQLFFLLCLGITSCTLKTTKQLTEVNTNESTFQNSYFSDPQKDYVYKAKIEAFGNNYGGILVIKKIKAEHHRVVFTTEFGAKIFDFEFNQSAFTVNYVVAALNKKIIIKQLRKNFQVLVKETLPLYKKYVGEGQSVYHSRWNKQHYFYFFSEENDLLEKMIQTSNSKEKVLLKFEANNKQFAHQVQISHQKIPLKIDLKGF